MLAAAELASCADAPAPAMSHPNVLFILTDDQRWDALGCHEKPLLNMKTPNLDRLAKEGARFRNYFCTSSLCSPSRASMLSGLYAHTHKIINNFTDYPSDLQSYPRQLQASGYQTAYIGKFHMGENNDEKRPGFDYWVTHLGQGQYYETTFNINGERVMKPGYYTTVVTDLAIDWLTKLRDPKKPFCLTLGHKAPHGPFVPEDKYKHIYDDEKVEYPKTSFDLSTKPAWVEERLDTWHGIYGPLYAFRKQFPDRSKVGEKIFGDFERSYVATINSVDDSVGRMYETLQKMGELDNTLIVFCGDNGFLLGEHGMIDKRTMDEASIRVPLLVRYPKLIKPGTKIDEMVLNIDLAPSILNICGVAPFAHAHGQTFKPLFSGDTLNWRKSFLYEYNYEKQFPYTPNVRGVRTAEWKYIHYPPGDLSPEKHKAELYNLKDDPEEKKNLIDNPKYASKVTELKMELQRLQDETGALPDAMPLDEGIKAALPEKSIR